MTLFKTVKATIVSYVLTFVKHEEIENKKKKYSSTKSTTSSAVATTVAQVLFDVAIWTTVNAYSYFNGEHVVEVIFKASFDKKTTGFFDTSVPDTFVHLNNSVLAQNDTVMAANEDDSYTIVNPSCNTSVSTGLSAPKNNEICISDGMKSKYQLALLSTKKSTSTILSHMIDTITPHPAAKQAVTRFTEKDDQDVTGSNIPNKTDDHGCLFPVDLTGAFNNEKEADADVVYLSMWLSSFL